MKKVTTIGIPKNSRLREEVQPVLSDALNLTQTEPGILKSPYLEDTRFIEMKICDLVNYLRRQFLDIILISDAKGLEESVADNNLKRCFGLSIDSPAVLRLMSREEDEERMAGRLMEDRNVKKPLYEKGVSTYPSLMRYYLDKRFNKDLSSDSIWTAGGQVESFMRTGVVPNLNFAYDIVGTGNTSRKFGLVSMDTCDQKEDKALRIYPSVWCRESLLPYQEDALEDVLPEIRERVRSVIEIDEKNATELLRI